MIKLLKIKDLYNKCDTSLFTFKSTKDIKITSKIISHDRALAGIDTALGIKENGFNLFVMGEKGRGKHSLLIRLIKEKTKKNGMNVLKFIVRMHIQSNNFHAIKFHKFFNCLLRGYELQNNQYLSEFDENYCILNSVR